jgi:hypothetical protein
VRVRSPYEAKVEHDPHGQSAATVTVDALTPARPALAFSFDVYSDFSRIGSSGWICVTNT